MTNEKKERTNEDRKEMAQRQLDGMTVNRDLMAKDVLFLARQNDELATMVANLTTKFVELQSQFDLLRRQSDGDKFAGMFTDLFEDIFKQPKDPKKPH